MFFSIRLSNVLFLGFHMLFETEGSQLQKFPETEALYSMIYGIYSIDMWNLISFEELFVAIVFHPHIFSSMPAVKKARLIDFACYVWSMVGIVLDFRHVLLVFVQFYLVYFGTWPWTQIVYHRVKKMQSKNLFKLILACSPGLCQFNFH